MNLGKENYCLRGLLDKGLIKARTFRNSRNEIGICPLADAEGAAQIWLMRRLLRRKAAEFEASRRGLRVEEGGWRMSAHLTRQCAPNCTMSGCS